MASFRRRWWGLTGLEQATAASGSCAGFSGGRGEGTPADRGARTFRRAVQASKKRARNAAFAVAVAVDGG
eukprot:365411-Chlamydomonas_euryale.AAC.7